MTDHELVAYALPAGAAAGLGDVLALVVVLLAVAYGFSVVRR